MLPRFVYTDNDGDTHPNAEWAEVTQTSTGEYIGWVPVVAVWLHGRGLLDVDTLRRLARPEPPAGLVHMSAYKAARRRVN